MLCEYLKIIEISKNYILHWIRSFYKHSVPNYIYTKVTEYITANQLRENSNKFYENRLELYILTDPSDIIHFLKQLSDFHDIIQKEVLPGTHLFCYKSIHDQAGRTKRKRFVKVQ